MPTTTRPLPPRIDYLARDFKSFQRLMLDRLATLAPSYKERHAADLGMVLLDILAYSADHLSYQQDAVATEAYLGTARQRISVRRHARLLDYAMHDGSNARAFVAFQTADDADGVALPQGTRLLTRAPGLAAAATGEQLLPALAAGAQVFETMHALTLHPAHDTFDPVAAVPAGATSATLGTRRLPPGAPALQSSLHAGDLLVLEETAGQASGLPEDADPDHRQVVRLTAVSGTADPEVVSVTWAAGDALAFSLSFGAGVARGNVALADHGQTLPDEALSPIEAGERPRLSLSRSPLTQQGSVTSARGDLVAFDPEAPAAAALVFDVRAAQPAVTLLETSPDIQTWRPRRDLVASNGFATDFVVEVDDAGTARLRFGDDVFGKQLEAGTTFTARYRVGNGLTGNVGAEAVAHVIVDGDQGTKITGVRNPLPAQGGADPETLQEAQINVPQALHVQARAVTLADHATLAMRHPEVESAVGLQRWNGSFYSVVVVVQRRGGLPVDAAFQDEVRVFLEPFRMAGRDIEIAPPALVPLDLALSVQVTPGHLSSDVLAALSAALGTGVLPEGQRAFFHPDNFTFGQAIYFSDLASSAMQVDGVAWVETDPALTRFRRAGDPSPFDPSAAVIQLGPVELPQRGSLVFNLQGGQ